MHKLKILAAATDSQDQMHKLKISEAATDSQDQMHKLKILAVDTVLLGQALR
jgi:hypothetical protein